MSIREDARLRGLRTLRSLVDVAILTTAYVAAFYLRFDGQIPDGMVERMLFTLPLVVGAKMALLHLVGMHRTSWRYVSMRYAVRLSGVLGLAGLGLFVARYLAASAPGDGILAYGAIPMGVILIDAVLSFVGLGGARVARRLHAETSDTRQHPAAGRRSPTLLVGAGQAGFMLMQEVQARPDLGIRAVGFLDDDPRKIGSVIRGVPVLGRIDELEEIAARTGAEQVLITMANVQRTAVRRVTELCAEVGLPTKIIPGLFELVGGRVSITRIRDIEIEDLLGREVVESDMVDVARHLAGRSVLVTGAGGSIGTGLVRQIVRFSPGRLTLVDKSEGALFAIGAELDELTGNIPVESVLADIRDEHRMDELFERAAPHVVFHAAAHKHVPLMEANPGEAIKNNIFGTKTIAEAADRAGVETFVGISTDKAVNPTSVMGATKRAAELYIQMLDRQSDTRFMTVRFGNVLDSSGSVIPTFKRQIERGGPVTVTHPDMTRYFMTIPEASQLVLQAAAMGEGGEIFVLDMGEPVRILDLAHDLVRLSGYEPGADIEVVCTGPRPGEKLHEELLFPDEQAQPTKHPKILVGQANGTSSDERFAMDLAELLLVCDDRDPALLRQAMRQVVREYRPGAAASAEIPSSNGHHEPTTAAEPQADVVEPQISGSRWHSPSHS